jgi:pimeloyl-ACP methyl ester carboxylesterase
VPVDYAHPSGDKLNLAVIRLPASNRPSRIGSLIMNPGGPGGSGVDFLRGAASHFPDEIRQRFDLVSFDPRWVGRSQGLQCLSDSQQERFFAATSRAELLATAAELAQACRPHMAALSHSTTFDVARDLESLRAALGDRAITYLGFSYGTLLGQAYAILFPSRIRAMALDGPVDPTLSWQDFDRGYADGFEEELEAFAAWCSKQNCPLGASPAQVSAAVDAMVTRLNRTPQVAGTRRLTGALAIAGLLDGLLSEGGWPSLREALRDLRGGDGGALLAMSDDWVGRDPSGHYDHRLEAYTAVSCSDRPYPKEMSAYDDAAQAAARSAPLFGAAITYGDLPCAFWPVHGAAWPQRPSGSTPILIVGTTGDPATPFAWARAVAGRLSHGVLLIHRGEGHTAYLGDDPCIERTVDRYLLAVSSPGSGLVCG